MKYVLQRYLDGNCEQVWTDLLVAGAALRDFPGAWDEAQEIVTEMMNRVRQNVEVLHDRLPSLGYRFTPMEEVYVPPGPDTSNDLDELEASIGRLPLALRAFFEIVGAVDLSGEPSGWQHPYPDPLVVYAPTDYLLSEHADRMEQGQITAETPFRVEFAPDYLHKANISGGAPYSIEVPNAAVDGLVLGEIHQTTFVNYLRTAFRWAGFPGWDRRHPHRDAPAPAFPEELVCLARVLQPI